MRVHSILQDAILHKGGYWLTAIVILSGVVIPPT
jgi:hypothetical protein